MYQDNPYSHVWFNKIKLILHGTLNKEFKLEQKRSEIEVNFVIEINYYQKYPLNKFYNFRNNKKKVSKLGKEMTKQKKRMNRNEQ